MAQHAESTPPAETPPKAPAGAGPAPAAGSTAAKAPSTSPAPAAGSAAAKAPPAAPASASRAAKDSRGLSTLDEMGLERSILRRGLATAQEIEACKAYRVKLASGSKDGPKGLLEIMIEAKVLTKNQSIRLLKEAGPEASKKFEVPGYQILEKIGKGSMGVVYKARQTSVDRVVAVKVLLESLARNKEFIKRFDREAKIAAKLSHNNIVNAIDAGEVDGHPYFVMEFIEGWTIKDEIDKGKVFDEKVAMKIVLAVAEALQHAHTRGLIHRDIKPENVILTKDGNVKLADLGLARLTADEKWAMSEAGMAIGTPYYISPEQVRGQVDVDIRGDIYSLGATLYHMVTGKVPYTGDTPSVVMRKHVDKNTNPIPPDHINTKLSSGLGVVVETMMAKNRENRYRNPDDLIIDLKCLMQGEAPIIAGQKYDDLATLAEGEVSEDEGDGTGASDAQLAEMAGYVNSRHLIIGALAAMLALSMVTNVLFLAKG